VTADHPPDSQVTPQGATIPVPKRGEFDANLDKLLQAPRPPKKVTGKRAAGAPGLERDPIPSAPGHGIA
jgi:hypothetical protein